MKRKFFAMVAILMLGTALNVFSQTRNPNQQTDPEKEKLLELASQFHQQHLVQQAEVERVSQEQGWMIRQETEEQVFQIMYIDEFGFPQAYITTNLNAAKTTNTDDLWTGGSSGLNLSGSGYLVGEWDGGGVLTTHQEFDNGSGTRVTQMDSPGSTHWHSTHVAGTMIAEGQVSSAHGMAPEALLNAYEWTDDATEMTTAAANGLTLSNHSYGWNRGWTYNSSNGYWYWYGNTSISTTEDYLFGFYDASSQQWDQIAYNAPNYLIVKSSGNDRNDSYSGGHYVWGGSSWVWSTATRDPDGGSDGYDCIEQQGCAKNILTIGAVNDITGGWTSPSDVVMSAFSSWGPTDDGRIKPDLVANGVGLYSTSNSSNSGYTTSDGTSMSTPNTTGTLALLQDYYKSLHNGTMTAAALKGLVINTANEAGPADGPDYMFGWGLLNATGAASLITADDTEGGLIVQAILMNGQTSDYTYYSNGSEINVTLCWTDPPGTPSSASLNPTALKLENDLDVRVIGTSTYYPWMLTPSTPSAVAYKGDNYRDNVETVNIKTPSPGYYTIRVNHSGTLTGGLQAYALIIRGLTTPPPGTYCDVGASSWNAYEYISNVSIGSINHTTGRSPGGYADYTGKVTTIAKGVSQTLSVTINGFTGDQGRAWADWNKDGDFTDAGEEFILGSGAGPVYSTSITVPTTALGGYTTLRVRLTYNVTPMPCNTVAYGETEDYTIQVTGTPGLWTGTVSSDWFNPLNWDDGNLPTSTTDVTIQAGTPFSPAIATASNAYCRHLFLNSGSSLTQSSGWFNCYGNFDAGFGTFTMSGTSYLYFSGSTNTLWWDDYQDDTYTNVRVDKSAPTASMNMQNHMTCSGTFEIREGTFSMNDGRILTVTNTGTTAFEVESGGILILDGASEIISVAGAVHFFDGSQAILTNGTIRCGTNFSIDANTSYNIAFTGGTLEMNGSSTQYINDLDGGDLDLYNLTINKSGGVCYLQSANLDVNGNLLISGGTLSCENGPSPTAVYNIHVAGNWTNNVGTSGFLESSGRVIFDGGNYHQYCSNETFNILEVNKPAGGAFRVNGATVVCAAYDWTAGAVDVLSGVFTANDLLDNAIKGAFYNNTGGTINLINSGTGTYVDLSGEIHNYGGTYNITGTVSWWPYLSNAVIEMNAGVIDFTSCGIYIYDTPAYSLTDNITGGTIRTSVGFSGNRSDFTPASGTFEFYGTNDATISQSNGCSLPNVVINKSGTDVAVAFEPEPGNNPQGKRIDITKAEGSKSNSILLSSNVTITNNLQIATGTLKIQNFTCSVAKIADVFGTLLMDNASGVLNVGSIVLDWLYFHPGSVGNLSAGTINLPYALIIENGATVNAGTGHTFNFGTTLNFGGIYNASTAVTLGNINVNMNGGKWILDSYSTAPFNVNGNFTIFPNNIVEMNNNSMTIHGILTDQSTSQIYVYNGPVKGPAVSLKNGSTEEVVEISATEGGNLVIDTDFTLNGLMDVGDGSVVVHGEFASIAGSSLVINGGSFIADSPNHPDEGWEYLAGNLTLTSGLFEITNNSIRFQSTATTSVSGGIMRTGGAFYAGYANTFKPTGGVVEVTGATPDIAIYCGNGNYFHNLTINRTPGYSTYFVSYDVLVKNDLTIQSGTLYTNGLNILIGGDWYNNVGTGGFVPSTGTVTFQSLSDVQDVYGSTNFYNVTQLYSTAMNYLRFQDPTTIQNNLELHHFCWAYDVFNINGILNINDPASKFTANSSTANATIAILDQGGSIQCNGNATITVNDLLESGLFGTILLNTGTFNIYQDNLQYVDLNANLTIQEGTMNVYGNYGGASYWPYTNAASITMSGGILDFKEIGIYVNNAYTFTENITNGTIRTPGGFQVYRNDFSPTGGTLELYGGTDVPVITSSGSNLFNLTINKTGGTDDLYLPTDFDGGSEVITSDLGSSGTLETASNPERIKPPFSGTKANTVTVTGDLLVQGTTLIDEGTFLVSSFSSTHINNINILSGGKLTIGELGVVKLENNRQLNINNGGTLLLAGTGINPATLTHNTGYYALNAESGGFIGANYGVFEYMNLDGIHIKAGANVDPANPFNYCTFRNGQSGGTLLTINNSQTFSVTDAVFPANTWSGAFNVAKTVNSGTVNFINATGGFAGAGFENDTYNRINWALPALTFNLKIFLEGPFDPATNKMKTDLNPTLPVSQPYDPPLPYFGNAMPDWYYGGSENVGSIPNAYIVDWVVVQLRDATSPATATPATTIATQAAFVNNVGDIVGLNGLSPLTFTVSYTNNLYAVVWHHNHLGVISANGLVNVGGTFTYDFSTGSGQAYGGTNAQKQLATGMWGLIGGDSDGSGLIGLPDRDNAWDVLAGSSGYKAADLNMNGQVNNVDKNDKWYPNIGKGSFIPE